MEKPDRNLQTTKKKYLLFLLSFATAIFSIYCVSAIAVTTCGGVLSVAGATYTLSNSISATGSGAICLNVTADNIILDLASYTISGNSQQSTATTGIKVINAKNLTIKNGDIANEGVGITIDSTSTNATINNVHFRDSTGYTAPPREPSVGCGGNGGTIYGLQLYSNNSLIINSNFTTLMGGDAQQGYHCSGTAGTGGTAYAIYNTGQNNNFTNNSIIDMRGGFGEGDYTGGYSAGYAGSAYGIDSPNTNNTVVFNNLIKSILASNADYGNGAHPGGNGWGLYLTGINNLISNNNISVVSGGTGTPTGSSSAVGGNGGTAYAIQMDGTNSNVTNNFISTINGGSCGGGSGYTALSGSAYGIYSDSNLTIFKNNTLQSITGANGCSSSNRGGGDGGAGYGIYNTKSTLEVTSNNITSISAGGGGGGSVQGDGNSAYGISIVTYLSNISNNNIQTIYCGGGTINGVGYGLYLNDGTINNTIYNNLIRIIPPSGNDGGRTSYGIYFSSIKNSTIYNNQINAYDLSGNSWVGYLSSSSGNNFYNNLFIRGYYTSAEGWASNDNAVNYWNMTKTSGRNIANGPYLGGNAWLTYDNYDLLRAGYSYTCSDNNYEGICVFPSTTLTIFTNNLDRLPLKYIFPLSFTYNSPTNGNYFQPTVTFNITTNSAALFCWFSINGTANRTMTNSSSTNWFNTTTTSAEGSNNVTYYCNDSYGAISTSSNINYIVDTLYPLISYGAGTENDGVNKSQNYIYINTTWTEANFKNITFRYNSTLSYTSTSPIYAYNYTSLPSGVYNYNVTLCDLANNCNTTATRKITLDTINPNATLISPANNTFTPYSNSITADSSLVMWQRLEQGNGTFFVDNTGRNNGTCSGATCPTLNQNGKIGNAYNFDGINDDIQVTQSSSLNVGNGSFSYGLWVYPFSNITDYDMPFWKGGSSLGAIGFDMELGSGPWYASLSDGIAFTTLTFSSVPLNNQWSHLFVVIDKNAGRALGYLNGNLVSNVTLSAGNFNSTLDMSIGSEAGSYPFNGTIDEVMIFNRSLSGTEINSLYHAYALTANLTDNFGIKNATLNVYNQTTLINQTTVSYVPSTLQTTVGIVVSLIDGVYRWFYNIFDWSGNSFTTINNTLTIDTTNPLINIVYPNSNNIWFNSQIGINYTVSDTNLAICKWTNNAGTTNTTITCGTNITGQTWSQGSNTVTVYVNDSAGNINSSTRQFNIDTINPLINFTNPTATNNSYVSRNWIFANISLIETNPANLTYTLYNSTGLVNQTAYNTAITNINWTNLPNGVYYYNVSATDSANNKNSTETRIITLDTTYPLISYIAPTANDGANLSQSIIYVNVAATETNFANITFRLSDGDYVSYPFFQSEYDFDIGTAYGVYYYNVTLCDLANNCNTTATRKIMLDAINPNATQLTPPNNTYLNYSNINFTANLTDNLGIKNATLTVYNSTSLVNQTSISYIPNTVQNTIGIVVNLIENVYTWFYNVFDWAGNSFTTANQTLYVDLANVSYCHPIQSPGIYVIDKNITATGTCFTIQSSNITIDCNNNSLIGPASGTNYGIYVNGYNNITIKNCNIRNFQSQIYLTNSINDNLLNNNMSNSAVITFYGIRMEYVNNTVINNNIIANNPSTTAVGIRNYYSNFNTINNSIINSNTGASGSYGIFSDTSQNLTVINSKLGSHANYDIYLNENKNALVKDTNLTSTSVGGSIASSTNNIYLNTTESTGSIFGTAPYQFVKQWYVTGFVNSSAGPVDLANFQIRDSVGTLVSDLTTFLGTIPQQIETQYYYDGTTLMNRIPLNFKVFKMGYVTNSTNVSISNNYYHYVVLQQNIGPTVSVVYPQSGYNYSTTSQTLNYTVSAPLGTDKCWYSLNGGATNTTITCGNNVTGLTAAQGSNTWTVWANDTNSNLGSSSTTFFIDSIYPLINFTNPTATNNSYVSRNWIFANISLTEINLKNLTYNLFNTTGLVNSTIYTTAITNINWTNLPNNKYYYNVTACDIANNCNSTETRIITLDTNYPTIQFVSPTENNNSYKSQTNVYMNTSYAETNFKNTTFYIYNQTALVNSAYTTDPAIKEYNFTSLTNGIYYYNVTLCDLTSQCNSTETRKITLDTANPNATLISPTNNTNSNNINQNLTANITDNIGIQNTTLYVYNTTSLVNQTTITSITGQTQSIVGVVVSLVEGIYNWFYQVFDLAGNKYTSTNNTLIIDTTLPVINITSPLAGNYAIAPTSLNYTINDAYASRCWYSNGTINSSAVVAGINFTIVPLEGTNTYTIYCNDSAGNINASSPVSIYYDSVNVTFCRNLIVANIYHIVQNNIITNTTDRCIDILANNVTLDLNGKTLGYDIYNASYYNRHLINDWDTAPANYTTIFNGTIINADAGLYFSIDSYYGHVYNMNFTSDRIGVWTYNYNTNYNNHIIENNIFSNMEYSIAIGAQSIGAYNTNITVRNNTQTNSTAGIYIQWGNGNNLIENNNINTTEYALLLDGSNSGSNTIRNNNFTSAVSTVWIGGNYGNDTFLNNNIQSSAGYPFYWSGSGIDKFIYNNSYANVLFNLNVNTVVSHDGGRYNYNDLIINNTIIMNDNFVSIRADRTSSQFPNYPANITLYGIGNRGFIFPAILKNGSTCLDCQNFTALTASTVIFNISSSGNYTIGEDTIYPVLDIVSPQNGQTYTSQTLSLNYTVSDANLQACWWRNETGPNITIACGTNTTLTQIDGTHTVYMWANDTQGHVTSANSTYTISTTAPALNLDNPTNNQYLPAHNVLLNFTAADSDGISTCQLWANWSGTWAINQSLTNVVSGQQTNFTIVTLPDANYKWNVWCNDTLNNGAYAQNNYTFTVDTTNPLIQFVAPTENNNSYKSQTNVYMNTSYTEANFKNITFYLYNQTALANSAYSTDPTIREYNFTGLTNGAYSYNVTICDLVNFCNTTETRIITLDTANPNAILNTPANNTYSSNTSQNLTVNISDNIGIKNTTLYVYNSTGLVNQTTISSFTNPLQDTIGIVVSLIDNIYHWFYQIFDLAGNQFTSVNNTLTIDTVKPLVSITYPINGTTYSNPNVLNYTVTDVNPSRCWYSNGTTNSSSVQAGINFSISPTEGNNNYILYCNDSAGNINSSTVSFNYDSSSVTQCRILSIANAIYTLQNNVSTTVTCFNITANNITLNLNGYTISGNSADTYQGIAVYGRKNITLNGPGTVKNFGGYGTYLFATNNSLIQNIIYTNDAVDGLRLSYANNNTFNNLQTIINPNNGVAIDSNSLNNAFYNTTSYSNNFAGIFLESSNNSFYAASLSANDYGFYFTDSSSNNILYNVESFGNGPDSNIHSFSWASTLNNILIYNNSFGQIKLKQLNADVYGSARLGNGYNIQISNNSAYLNGSAIPGLNLSANVTLFNIGDRGFIKPGILKDGNYCLDCVNFTSLTANTVIFSVQSWSNYTIGETQPSIITLNTPSNNSYSITPVNLTANITSQTGIVNSTVYVYNSTNLVNQTTITLSGVQATVGVVVNLVDGIYRWFYNFIDTIGGTYYSENRTLNMDSTGPVITINTPKAQTYPNATQLLNITISDQSPISNYWYTLDNGITNNTFTNPQYINFNAGPNLLNVYANDSAGNINNKTIGFYITYTNAITIGLSVIPAIQLNQNISLRATVTTDNTKINNCSFTLISPTRTIFSNVNGTQNGTIWTSPYYVINETGLYNYSVICVNEFGYNGTVASSFNSTYAFIYTPTTYNFAARVAKNETNGFSVYAYDTSNATINYAVSADIQNASYFTMTYPTTLTLNDSDSVNNRFPLNFTINASLTVPVGNLYHGNITFTNPITGISYVMNFTYGIMPPSGIPLFWSTTDDVCTSDVSSVCSNANIQLQQDQSTVLSLKVGNIGQYDLSNCSIYFTYDLNNVSWTSSSLQYFNIPMGVKSTFNLTISPTTSTSIGTYSGYLYTYCRVGDALGSIIENAPNNRPFYKVIVSSKVSPGPGPSGGGGTSPTLNLTNISQEILKGYCGNKVCEPEVGETYLTCSSDCKGNLNPITDCFTSPVGDQCILKQTTALWWIFAFIVLIILFTIFFEIRPGAGGSSRLTFVPETKFGRRK